MKFKDESIEFEVTEQAIALQHGRTASNFERAIRHLSLVLPDLTKADVNMLRIAYCAGRMDQADDTHATADVYHELTTAVLAKELAKLVTDESLAKVERMRGEMAQGPGAMQ